MTDSPDPAADDVGGIVPPYMLDRIVRSRSARSLRRIAALARRSSADAALRAGQWSAVAVEADTRADELDATLDPGSAIADRD